MIGEALSVMWSNERRMIRVVGPSPPNPDVLVETVINEWVLSDLMLDYSSRILVLSVVRSLMTATLVFLQPAVAFRPSDAGYYRRYGKIPS